MSEWQFPQLHSDELASICGAADGGSETKPPPIGSIATEGDREFRSLLNGALKTGQLQAEYMFTKRLYGDMITDEGQATLDRLNGRIDRRMVRMRALFDTAVRKMGR